MLVSIEDVQTMLGKSLSLTAADLALLSLIQVPVESAIKRHVGCKIEHATNTHYLPARSQTSGSASLSSAWEVYGSRAVRQGRGSQVLQLPETPVRSITAMYEDPGAMGGQAPNAFPASTLLTQGVDYYVDVSEDGVCRSGRVIRPAGWSIMPRSVKAVYVSGYTADELAGAPDEAIDASHIRQAVLKQMMFEFNSVKQQQGAQGIVVEESLGDYRVQYLREASPDKIALLDSVKELLSYECNYARLIA